MYIMTTRETLAETLSTSRAAAIRFLCEVARGMLAPPEAWPVRWDGGKGVVSGADSFSPAEK